MLPKKNVTFTPVTSCLNCGNPLTDKDFFCNICGAKKIEERFTPKRIVKEAGEQVFNVDNTFASPDVAAEVLNQIYQNWPA
mgnify:CR=1 FL=1